MAYVNRYQYETSPRKLQPEYEQKPLKYPKKSIARKIQTTNKTKNEKEVKKNGQIKYVFYVLIGFTILFAISYRNSIINEEFTQIKSLKTQLAAVEKENTQLEVNIQSNLNLKNVEQNAKELLGMQKLNNKQTIYVSLPKKDYIESATEEVKIEEEENWIVSLIKDLLGTIK